MKEVSHVFGKKYNILQKLVYAMITMKLYIFNKLLYRRYTIGNKKSYGLGNKVTFLFATLLPLRKGAHISLKWGGGSF